MITDSPHLENEYNERSRSALPKIIAALCALLVTAAILGGYAYLRRRHAEEALAKAKAAQQAEVPSSVPKGPAKAHILVDEPTLKGSQSIVGGSVKNISHETLAGLTVELELRRRKDGLIDQMSIPLDPPQLDPEQEGRYSVVLLAQDYSSAKLVGLRSSRDSSLIAYSSAPGQKRPLERLEPKTIVVQRPSPGGRSEFLNSPDNPARVP
jgi:hypothetical protein